MTVFSPTTILTPEQQKAVLRWPETLDIGIIQAYTSTKKVGLNGWQSLDFQKVDFKANLANGVYDIGIAVQTGKTIYGKYYLVVLDLDGREGVNAWFESWENVLALSKKTLVEWHQDQGKIHVFRTFTK